MSTRQKKKNPSNSLLVSHIRSFLDSYQNEQRKNKAKSVNSLASSGASSGMSFGSMSSFDSMSMMGGQADPTTANALNTSTVVILRKKKNSSLKNSPFDGVCLPNYRLRLNDVRHEVFDWVSHFLWLKNCPVELATPIAIHIADRMDTELMKKFEDTSTSNKSPVMSPDNNGGMCLQSALMSSPESIDFTGGNSGGGAGGIGSPLNPFSSSLDTLDSTPRSSLPSALCSVDVAKQSRERVNEFIEELSTNPENAVEMVNDYLDNGKSSSQSIDDPDGVATTTTTNNSSNGLTTPFTSSIFAIKNGRKTMEDRHIIIHDLNKALNLQTTKQYSYYAIFDGHAGVDAASYSSAHLHNNLVSTQAFAEGRIEDAFQEAFEKTDSLYIKRCREDGVDQLKPSGTTALCALIEDNKTVYMAWVGDSQAVLVRNGRHEEIMLPHRPDVESERTRIQDLGGLVVFVDTWRVNGVLSVTRAIGDPEHKPYVIAEPSLAKFEIDSSLDFLVLGCDGLFDQLASQEIAAYVFEFLCRNENRDPQEVMHDVSSYLSQMAIKEGSSDNITSIVIFFKPFEQLVATGYPTDDHETNQIGQVEEIVNASEHRASVTTLPTTNGGHFPYTDFAELPIGSNYKLSDFEPVPNGSSNSNNTNDDCIEENENVSTFDSMIEHDLEQTQHQPQTIAPLPESFLLTSANDDLLLMGSPAVADTSDTTTRVDVLDNIDCNSQITSSPFFDNSISTFCVSQPEPKNESCYVTDDQLIDQSADQPTNLLVEQQSDLPINQQADQPLDLPTDQQIVQSSDLPVVQSLDLQSDQPADLLVDQRNDNLADLPIDLSVEQPLDLQVEKSSDLSVDQPLDLQVEKSTDLPVDQPSDQPFDLLVEQPSDLLVDQPFDQLINQSSDLLADQPLDLPTDQQIVKSSDLSFDLPVDLPVDHPTEIVSESTIPEVESTLQSAVTSDSNDLLDFGVSSEKPTDVSYFEQQQQQQQEEHEESNEVILTSCLSSSLAQVTDSSENLFDNDSDNCDFVFVKPSASESQTLQDQAVESESNLVCNIASDIDDIATTEPVATTMEETSTKVNGFTNGHGVNGDHAADSETIQNIDDGDLVNTFNKLNLSGKDNFADDKQSEDGYYQVSSSSVEPLNIVIDQTMTDNNIPQLDNVSEPNLGELVDTTTSIEIDHPVDDSVDNSAPQIIQHPSDSGYCYTNSINEFSTSFPSTNKREENFCSTPLVPAEMEIIHATTVEDESGLAGNNQSSILPDAAQENISELEFDNNQLISDNNNLENSVGQSSNANDSSSEINWENSLHNNSTVFNDNVMQQTPDESVMFESNVNNETAFENITDMVSSSKTDDDLLMAQFELQPTPSSLEEQSSMALAAAAAPTTTDDDTAVCQLLDADSHTDIDSQQQQLPLSVEPVNAESTLPQNVTCADVDSVVSVSVSAEQPQPDNSIANENFINNDDNNDNDILTEQSPQTTTTTTDLIDVDSNLPNEPTVQSTNDNLMFDLSQSAQEISTALEMKSQLDEITSSTDNDEPPKQSEMAAPVPEVVDLESSSVVSPDSEPTLLNVESAPLEAEPALVELESALAAESASSVESAESLDKDNVTQSEPLLVESKADDSCVVPQEEDSNKAGITPLKTGLISTAAAAAAVAAASVVGAVSATKDAKKPAEVKPKVATSSTGKKPLTTSVASKLKTATARAPLSSSTKLSATKTGTTATSVAARTSTTTRAAPLKSTTAKPATTSTVTSRLSTSTLNKTRSSSTLPAASKSVPAATARVPAARKPLTSSLAPKTSTTASRPATGITRPATSTTRPAAASTIRPATTASRLTSTSTARPAATSRLTTTSSSQLRTAPKADSKPAIAPIRKPLSTTKPSLIGSTTSKPTAPARTSTLPARTATKPAASTRPAASKAPAPVASKVGSLRPASTTRPLPSRLPAKTTPSNKTNGTSSPSASTNGQVKAVGRKPAPKIIPVVADESATSPSDSSAPLSNGNSVAFPGASMKNSTSFTSTHKRNNLIGVENSLKQELEDAVMNEMNGSMILSGIAGTTTDDLHQSGTNGNSGGGPTSPM